MWYMGSSCMELSPPESTTARGTNDGGLVVEENLNSMQMEPHLDCKASTSGNLVRSPSRDIDIMPMCHTMSHKHNEGPSGDMEELTNKIEVSVVVINQDADRKDDKEKVMYSPTDTQKTNISGTRRDIIPFSPEKASTPGPDNGRTAKSSSIKMNEPKLGSALELPGYAADLNNEGTAGVLATKVSIIKQCKLPATPTCVLTHHVSKYEGLASVIEKQCKSKMMTTGFTDSPQMEKPESTSENDLQPLKGIFACVEVVASQPHQTEGLLPKDDVASAEASPNYSGIPLRQRKGKGKALFDADIDGKILKDEDDSHESVESCNSAGLFLPGKRPWSFEQELFVGNKEMKKQIEESPRSASSRKQDSSFMNWISNMVKGLGKTNMDETTPSLALTTRPSNEHGSHDQHFTFHGRKQESGCTNTGFETIFKTLYCPSSSVQEKKIIGLDNELGEASEDLELVNKTCKEVVIPNAKTSTTENNNSCNIAYGLEKGGLVSSNSSFRNDSASPSEGKEACQLGSIDPNKSLNSITNRSSLLGNLWINRFSPIVSGHVKSSSQCNKNADAAVEGYSDCSKPRSHSQNCVVSVKDQNTFEYGREPEPCAEHQIVVASKKMQTCVADTTQSFGSKRAAGHTDQKFKTKLNPIQPARRFKSSEAMVSVFAKRLDALRHIIPTEVAGNSSHVTTICLFCGVRGHKLRDCPEITESEIDDLVKNVYLYDGAMELSCLCIRCFKLNHWAIACPNVHFRKRSHLNDSSSMVNFMNFRKILPVQDNAERNPTENKDCGYQVALIGTNVDEKSSGTMILDARVSDLKPAKKNLLGNYFCEGTSVKNTSREFTLNMKRTDSSSTEIESKENQLTSFCNFVNKQIPAVPRGTFEAIRRLRLSRTDILKWKQSSFSLFCLEGFFLRLRICKQEERLGGTGYYVACINGASRERSSGSSIIPLCVDVGGFKCSVESRFVSNRDFIEDELMAWWCATLIGGGKLPSEEHLKMKLGERRSFGF